ncbi:hypothetical protein Taro_041612, partial [Colocasia esculenta]|nr:hypothetical protein [Colocasia esculenta]
MSTPLPSTVLTAPWDSHLVSTHRWTVSTPLARLTLSVPSVNTTSCPRSFKAWAPVKLI